MVPNYRTLRMGGEQFKEGMRWLANKVYHPASFGERVVAFVDRYGKRRDPLWNEGIQGFLGGMRKVETDTLALVADFVQRGPEEWEMWKRIKAALKRRPDTTDHVYSMLLRYAQLRFYYEQTQVWDPSLASDPAPLFSCAES